MVDFGIYIEYIIMIIISYSSGYHHIIILARCHVYPFSVTGIVANEDVCTLRVTIFLGV